MNQNIKQWQEEERPREKMLAKGCESLTCAEIIAILIQSGTTDCNAVELARKILDVAGNNLTNLSRTSIERLCTIKGVGPAKAITVLAATELGRRIASESIPEEAPVRSSADIAAIMSPLLKGLQFEEFWTIFLNNGGKVICKKRLSSGGTRSTVIDIKLIVRNAVEMLAAGVILVHNHPSGDPHPGAEDVRQTAAVRKALSCLDIVLVDHLIIAGNKYFSFSDENY